MTRNRRINRYSQSSTFDDQGYLSARDQSQKPLSYTGAYKRVSSDRVNTRSSVRVSNRHSSYAAASRSSALTGTYRRVTSGNRTRRTSSRVSNKRPSSGSVSSSTTYTGTYKRVSSEAPNRSSSFTARYKRPSSVTAVRDASFTAAYKRLSSPAANKSSSFTGAYKKASVSDSTNPAKSSSAKKTATSGKVKKQASPSATNKSSSFAAKKRPTQNRTNNSSSPNSSKKQTGSTTIQKRKPYKSNPQDIAKKKRIAQKKKKYNSEKANLSNVRLQQGFVPAPPPQYRDHRPAEHRNDNPHPSKPNKTLYSIIFVLLVAIFLFAVYQLIAYAAHSLRAQREEDAIREMITSTETEINSESDIATSDETDADIALLTADSATDETDLEADGTSVSPTPTPAVTATPVTATSTPVTVTEEPMPEVLIQFTSALSINSDTVGQLEVGESISTYVVQRDNSYYLRRSFYDEYSFSGAIFLDVTCSIYPQSKNLIIHGHNMQDGTAFGKLQRYKDISYYNEYPVIHFSTLYESADYIPFAVLYYSVDVESEDYLDLYQVNSMTEQSFVYFIETLQSRSLYRIPVNVAKTDYILTLTTCATEDDDMRFAVFAVKNVI